MYVPRVREHSWYYAIMTAPFLIPLEEVEMTAIRAQGTGGQNVNKVASAIHLRFDIRASSLSEDHKQRLLALHDRRISRDGVIIIKSQIHRSQELNRADALQRLQVLVSSVAHPPQVRRATRPTWSSQIRRRETKQLRSTLKTLRSKVSNVAH
jgi:ribosome-associated protein